MSELGEVYTGNGAADPAEVERQRKLEEVRAARAAIAAKRAARAAQHQVKEEVPLAQIELENEQALEAAEAEYGPVDGGGKISALYAASGRVLILKRPNRILYQRFQDAGKYSTKTVQTLVQPCLVHPDEATFDAWLETEPALLDRAANAVGLLAGARKEELQGK